MSAVRTLFVSTGTDHHRFDRLADWVEAWMDARVDRHNGGHADHPGDHGPIRCRYQAGVSRAPRDADRLGIVSHDELLAHLGTATVVLTQGGPGSILDARGSGFVPIVVPRLAALNEVVDDHQVAFCRRLARDGEVVLAESAEQLTAALDAAFENPDSVRRPPQPSPAPETAARLSELVERVVARRPGFIAWRRLRRSA